MVRPPTRPMAATSSMWATPTTRVENTRGAMIILISRRKMSVTTERPSATPLASAADSRAWQAQPTAMPRTIAAATMSVNRRLMPLP